MASEVPPSSTESYAHYRTHSPRQLWQEDAPRFEKLTGRERVAHVGLLRALGVIMAEHGSAEDKTNVRAWLCRQLHDPEEKVRRYAINALPKLHAGALEEAALLDLLSRSTSEREQHALTEALKKIGGQATLQALTTHTGLSPTLQQKLQANEARQQGTGGVSMERVLGDVRQVRIHLRGRKGLESFIREEVETQTRTRDRFEIIQIEKGCVALRPREPFCLQDLYALRCCGSIGLVLGLVSETQPGPRLEFLARTIASPLTQRLLRHFHTGTARYRLEFLNPHTPLPWVQEVATRAFALCPAILNDSHQAPWAIDIHPTKVGDSVELRPRLSPDPRFAYRVGDIAAASHPPLAASLARWAGRTGKPERIWDPFCGSGLELIESGLLGNVAEIHGTDLSEEALAHARANFQAAGLEGIRNHFTCCDFRDYPKKDSIRPGSLSLVVSNPPLGRRIRIPNLRGLMENLFHTADQVLARGGRLIFANPITMDCPVPGLKLDSRIMADLGGFDCRLEKWTKL